MFSDSLVSHGVAGHVFCVGFQVHLVPLILEVEKHSLKLFGGDFLLDVCENLLNKDEGTDLIYGAIIFQSLSMIFWCSSVFSSGNL